MLNTPQNGERSGSQQFCNLLFGQSDVRETNRNVGSERPGSEPPPTAACCCCTVSIEPFPSPNYPV